MLKPFINRVAVGLWLATTCLLHISVAEAYIGPGLGAGAVIAIMLAVLLLIIGPLWYPLKKLFSRPEPEENGEPWGQE